MIDNYSDKIRNALDVLQLPNLITKDDIKKQYRYLSKKSHPDLGGSQDVQEELNSAYGVLMDYIENFRYSFDDDEIQQQYGGVYYAKRFGE
jgi:DnaJ-class molecular chaperone